MSSLKIGVGEIDITPPAGLPLMGHHREDYSSTGTHDPLYSRAVVIQTPAGSKIALLTVDVLMLSRDKVALMRESIESRCGIPRDHTLVAATHTHAGPSTMELYDFPRASDEDIDSFVKKAARAAIDADRNISDADVNVGYAYEDRVSFNRRLRCRDGSTHMNWEGVDPEFVVEPLGPIDPQLIAVTINRHNRSPAALVNFALHPAILDYENRLYSADYVGYLVEAMKSIIGERFVTLFFNGCCGNINHIDYSDRSASRRGYKPAQRVGYMLAAATKKAMDQAVRVSDDTISISTEHVSLERLKINDHACRKSIHNTEPKRGKKGASHADGLPIETAASVLSDAYQKQHTDEQVEVMTLRIGDVAIVGFPAEMFCELGLMLKQKSPAKHTIPVELANGAVGYIPNGDAYGQGGYEDTIGVARYVKGSGEKLADSALRQLRKMF